MTGIWDSCGALDYHKPKTAPACVVPDRSTSLKAGSMCFAKGIVRAYANPGVPCVDVLLIRALPFGVFTS